jgi:hypothetical protein
MSSSTGPTRQWFRNPAFVSKDIEIAQGHCSLDISNDTSMGTLTIESSKYLLFGYKTQDILIYMNKATYFHTPTAYRSSSFT